MRLRLASIHPVVALGVAFLASMCMSEIPEEYGPGVPKAPDAAVRGDAAPIYVSCETASDCPIPPSICGGGDYVVYYTNPYCASGSCVWVRNTRYCGACSNGGCYNNATAGVPPSSSLSVCVAPTCSGCTGCVEDCECRWADPNACVAQCSEAGVDGSVVDASEGGADVVECTDLDFGRCLPPPAECIDAHTLGYFVNVSCVDYRCAWEQKSIECPCAGGRCRTTAGGPWSDSG